MTEEDKAELARSFLSETASRLGESTKGEYVKVSTAIAAIFEALNYSVEAASKARADGGDHADR